MTNGKGCNILLLLHFLPGDVDHDCDYDSCDDDDDDDDDDGDDYADDDYMMIMMMMRMMIYI